jgi:hypothetical protein
MGRRGPKKGSHYGKKRPGLKFLLANSTEAQQAKRDKRNAALFDKHMEDSKLTIGSMAKSTWSDDIVGRG